MDPDKNTNLKKIKLDKSSAIEFFNYLGDEDLKDNEKYFHLNYWETEDDSIESDEDEVEKSDEPKENSDSNECTVIGKLLLQTLVDISSRMNNSETLRKEDTRFIRNFWKDSIFTTGNDNPLKRIISIDRRWSDSDFSDHDQLLSVIKFINSLKKYAITPEKSKLLPSDWIIAQIFAKNEFPLIDVLKDSSCDKIAKLMLEIHARHPVVELRGIEASVCVALSRDEFPDVNLLKLLLAHGADPNRPVFYEDYRPPLMEIATRGNACEIAELLISHGAYLETEDFGELINDAELRGDIEYLLFEHYSCSFELSTLIERTENGDNFYTVVREIALRYVQNNGILDEEFVAELVREIRRNGDVKDRFRDCCKELRRMMKVKFYERVSLFDVLIMDFSKLMNYTRNESFVGAFNDVEFGDDFSTYAGRVIYRFNYATRRRALMDTRIEILRNILKEIFRTYSIPLKVVENVIRCMEEFDLRFLS